MSGKETVAGGVKIVRFLERWIENKAHRPENKNPDPRQWIALRPTPIRAPFVLGPPDWQVYQGLCLIFGFNQA